MSNPAFVACCRPEAGPGGCSRPRVSFRIRSPKPHAICEPFAREFECGTWFGFHVETVAVQPPIRAWYSRTFGHHIVIVRRRSSSARLFAALRPAPRAAGLDDACTPLEGSTHVMSGEDLDVNTNASTQTP